MEETEATPQTAAVSCANTCLSAVLPPPGTTELRSPVLHSPPTAPTTRPPSGCSSAAGAATAAGREGWGRGGGMPGKWESFRRTVSALVPTNPCCCRAEIRPPGRAQEQRGRVGGDEKGGVDSLSATVEELPISVRA